MAEANRVQEWVRFYNASPEGYRLNALLAVLESDGEKMLGSVLKALKIGTALELVKACQ